MRWKQKNKHKQRNYLKRDDCTKRIGSYLAIFPGIITDPREAGHKLIFLAPVTPKVMAAATLGKYGAFLIHIALMERPRIIREAALELG